MEQKLESRLKKPDANSVQSERRGLGGFLENTLRNFQILSHLVLVAPLYGLGAACVGAALVPGIVLYRAIDVATQDWSSLARTWALGTSVGAAYFLYGFSLLILVPLLNSIACGFKGLPAWRGAYYSLPAIRWYIHNGLTYLVRYTFMEFITPTPFNLFFYRRMGMKIGEGTIINSSAISDPSLIELGRKVTVGGSVTIVGHYGQGGYLVLAPVKVGDKATLGLRCVIMGGAEIGAEAKILPGSVVLPKTVVPPGEIWGGVPARKIEYSELKPESRKAS